jgi:hypothetical protein
MNQIRHPQRGISFDRQNYPHRPVTAYTFLITKKSNTTPENPVLTEFCFGRPIEEEEGSGGIPGILRVQ